MIPTSINGALATPEAGGTSGSGAMTKMAWGADQWRAWWWALGATALVLALAYAPNLGELGRVWREDDNYQHGFLIVPIALFILWRRMVEIPWKEPREVASMSWWGWGLLAVILAVRAVAYELSFQWLETATILPAIACLTWAFGGWPLLYRAWPAIFFLVFMLPLPLAVNGMIALPLQTLAATGSYVLLQISGFWVIQEGNVLNLSTRFGMRPLDVALACSGLKMLMTLAATVTATIMLLPLPRWKRLVLLASAVPIALVSNMSRIVTTGWCYYYIKGDRGTHLGHDISGLMMMPLALILVGLELKILSWLVPETTEAEEDDRKAILPLLTDKGPGAKKAREPEI
jgi:exosortase